MVSQSSSCANFTEASIVSGVSPGSPMIKSPWTTIPAFLQFFMNSRACWTVAPFLIFFRICGSPDSNPTMNSLHPADRIAFNVSRSTCTLDVQDQVKFKGLNFSHSSRILDFRIVKVSSSKNISFMYGNNSSECFTSAATSSADLVRHGCPSKVCGHKQNVHSAGHPRVVYKDMYGCKRN